MMRNLCAWSGAALVVLIVGGCSSGVPNSDGGTPTGDPTGILITTPTGSATESYDLFDATGTTRLESALTMGELENVVPGRYVVKAYFNDVFVYATDVQVVAGQTTVLAFGAVNVVTVPGSEEATYDIYDAAGQEELSDAESDNTIRPLPPGTYVLKDYFADDVLAANVTVTAGQVTTVP